MSVFQKIISGEIPAHKIMESDRFLAFLDVSPLVMGHVLVIPKEPVDYIFDMESEEYEGLWSFAKQVSVAVKAAFPCKKVGIAVVGLEVPHAHIHLVPIHQVSDMNFSKEKLKPSQQELADAAEKIRLFLI